MESGKEYLVRPSCRRKDAPMKTVLFVCTGNTCRSPMAECLFNALAREQGAPGVCAASAGLCAPDGAPASEGALFAMRRRGLSLEGHRRAP